MCSHLRRLGTEGQLGPEIGAVGLWWSGAGQNEIDAVALSGRSRTPVLVGEAKWARQVGGARPAAQLRHRRDALEGG